MPSATLPDRAILTVSGPDAQHFLQNIVTVDVDGIQRQEARASALLSPQGKVLFDFLLSGEGEDWLLETRGAISGDLQRRLMLYRLRAKVEISEPKHVGIEVSWGDVPAKNFMVRDTRFPENCNVFRRRVEDVATAHVEQWNALRIAYGIAESSFDFALGDAFPHDIGLDQNGGVGFRKGCFVGQEVVSRMQHRGTARRRVLIVEGNARLPPPGTEVTAVKWRGLAILRTDRVADAKVRGSALMAGEVPIDVALPPGVGYTLDYAGDDAAVEA